MKNIPCPKCAEILEVQDPVNESQKIQCKKCDTEFLIPNKNELSEHTTQNSEPLTEHHEFITDHSGNISGAAERLLGGVESLVKHMLIGAVIFPFVGLPMLVDRWCRRFSPTAGRFFPTAVRVIRIVVLSAIWLVIVIGPVILATFHELSPYYIRSRFPESILPILLEHSVSVQIVCWTWTVFTSIGSLWGVIHAQRKGD